MRSLHQQLELFDRVPWAYASLRALTKARNVLDFRHKPANASGMKHPGVATSQLELFPEEKYHGSFLGSPWAHRSRP